jgi:NAD(P)-dependent dehydrogenase (short-subunit alcohol dehydrogenase family)
MEIKGKVALVTGAGSGIGRATALALAKEGASVLVADVDEAGGAETVRQVEAAGGKAAFAKADVGSPDGIRGMFDACERVFGGVDIVHNNAGIMNGGNPNWPESSLEKAQQVINVNLSGVVMGTREAVHRMRKRGGGVVVNTASVAALGPLPWDPIYAATKAAVLLFTQSCAMLNQSDKVRVNTVLPGMVETPILEKTGDGITAAHWVEPMRSTVKLLRPEDIAAAVVDYVKDDSKAGDHRVVPNPR